MLKSAISILLCFLSAGILHALELPSRTPLWNGTRYNDAVPATDADRLHALGITGKGFTIAILDDGFDLNHEIFRGVTVHTSARGFSAGNGHGTHMAGIALSMAPDSALWLGESPQDTLADGLVCGWFEEVLDAAARYGIAALNNSWGHTEGEYANPADVAGKYPLTVDAVRRLLAAGVAVVGASGNSSVNGRVSFPDGLPGVMSVGALGPDGRVADFSTLYDKPGLFLLAPGVDIYSAYPTPAEPYPDRYEAQWGTSPAAPHVTGAITLLQSGARAASTEEILAALSDSAARVVYDPDTPVARADTPLAVLDPELAYGVLQDSAQDSPQDEPVLRPYIKAMDAIRVKYHADTLTAEDWRIYNSIYNALAIAFEDYSGNELEGFLEILELMDPLAPTARAEYGFLQVDAAYRLLTSRRSAKMAEAAASAGSAHAGALAGFAGALGMTLDQNLTDLFQRLDGQSADVLSRAARQLGPGWAASTMQSAVFGQIGLHAAAERRLEQFRLRGRGAVSGTESVAAPGGLMSLALPDGWTAWAEGFGGYHDRSETRDGSGYRGTFAGVTAGLEKPFGEAFAGGFASWANHTMRDNGGGDGAARGNWGTFGVYGGLIRDRFSAGLSVSAGAGDYDLTRAVDGPSAPLIGMNYGALRVHANGDSTALSFSARGTAAWTLFEGGGWEISPGAEAAIAHTILGGFSEEGGGGINLAVRRHAESYAEGGAGVRASKTFFRENLPFLTASVKASTLYGGGFGKNMRARFLAGGDSFSVSPERTRGAWFVPEASVSWRAAERVTVSASYQGRFGRDFSANTGSLSVGLDW